VIHPALTLAALLLPTDASAFCGTYVGSAGTALYNDSSQVVIARSDGTTHLTLANDYTGDASDFAVVIPVPELLSPEDVRIVDPEILARLDAYSAPRLVSYRCRDLHPPAGSYGGGPSYGAGDRGSSEGCAQGCQARVVTDAVPVVQFTAADADLYTDQDDTGLAEPLTPDAIESVEVAAEFAVGEYEIVVLSAEESTGLLQWLNLSGYAVPYATEQLLNEYIQGGSYFVAAKVSLDDGSIDRKYLSPLRISYEGDGAALPIRLGALNSPGIQSLTIFTINDPAQGKTSISNLEEVVVEDECMYDSTQFESFAAFYADRVREVMDIDTPNGTWTTEYSWQPSKCDPCTEGGPLTDEEARSLGYAAGAQFAHFTRLLVRYTPEQATEDLMLYASHLEDPQQVRFIVYDERLGQDFPVCGAGWTAEGNCTEPPLPVQGGARRSPLPGGAAVLLLGAGLVAPLRRRWTASS